MKVLIQGKQLKISEELWSYVIEKLVQPLTRFYDNEAAELRVEFGDNYGPKGGRDKECHLTLRMPGNSAIQIEEITQDCYASLDAAADRLIRVCKRDLDRMRPQSPHRRHHPIAIGLREGSLPYGEIEEAEEEQPAELAAVPET